MIFGKTTKIRISVAFSLLIFLAWALPAKAQESKLKVFFAGGAGKVLTALEISSEFELVPDIEKSDVIVLHGVIPDPERLTELVNDGTGLVIFMEAGITSQDLRPLFGENINLSPADAPLSLTTQEDSGHISATGIVWNGAPQVRERALLSGTDLEVYAMGFEDGTPILEGGRIGEGQVYIFTPFLEDANHQIQDWPYFNYLVYLLASDAGGRSPLSFGEYPASPVPHNKARTIIYISMFGLLLLSSLAYLTVRRYSKAHPEALDELITEESKFQQRQAKTDWEEVGFHRPLGGFLVAFILQLVLTIPLTIYTAAVLPVYILPSAQAMGIWGRVTQFFAVIWTLFDVGTSIAFIKFFPQYRVKDPRRAIMFGQFFVWWQMISGAIQVTIITILAGEIAPQTVYALYAWTTILHSIIQLPGFLSLFSLSLKAWQRFDYAQLIDIALAMFFPMVTQTVIVLAMYKWGLNNPVFGGTMGGLLGLPLAAYANNILSFLMGWWLYKRLGYNARVLFMAHFDWETIKTALKFGLYEMAGSGAYALGQAAEIVITTALLINYNEIWGNWGLAQSMAVMYLILLTLYGNLLPAISEAISNAKKKLSQYYAAIAYKWGGFISGFFCAVLLAVVDRFILGASGPEFVRAAEYAIPLIIYHALAFPTWTGDIISLAANRPYIKTLMTLGEQILRVVLVLLMIERFQIYALVYGYMIAIMIKNVVEFLINNRFSFRQRFYFWQSVIAPILAGAAHYGILRPLTGLLWKGDPGSSILIYVIGMIFSFPLYSFFYGLFGGWDTNTLFDFQRAVQLTSFTKPAAWLFWKASQIGASISPLHNRFPIDLYDSAMEEAKSLTEERVNLLKAAKTSLATGD